MDKSVKIVLILAIVFLIVIVWIGIKSKTVLKPQVKPGSPSVSSKSGPSLSKDKLIKLGPKELEKLDEGLMKLEERKKGATPRQAQEIGQLQRILESAKAKGRLPTREEMSGLMEPAPLEGLLPPLPEQELGLEGRLLPPAERPGVPPLPEGFSPEQELQELPEGLAR